MPPERSKDSLRARVLIARSALSREQWAADDDARTAAVLKALPDDAGVVATYASRAGEPGTASLLTALAEQGRRVLLPVLRREPDWAWYTGAKDLREGWGGIPEPTSPRLGAEALWMADVVLVPCLAVGPDGARLGTGGGWYDRALPRRQTGAAVWALARAAEVGLDIPTEPHDVAVQAVVTELGFSPLGS
ncbi:5-formyltetrahydrofolate cyclo-ligase [Tessaracoccus sp. OS52]|uniref:5-formyltetrahydrofolate cyclo-ligase n=1 Tax=Tessaracoccus sp. OS52 TaxID=2886691 RepID=UPI001D0FA206|nr:5-formyltetrahydrofolate cyclo-ligase [Tessaracoccus sp. OS52]MCC2592053.1 5-formyltetrahydrofolate cyclo-ligase [Tessaracoccus sp. OS52]